MAVILEKTSSYFSFSLTCWCYIMSRLHYFRHARENNCINWQWYTFMLLDVHPQLTHMFSFIHNKKWKIYIPKPLYFLKQLIITFSIYVMIFLRNHKQLWHCYTKLLTYLLNLSNIFYTQNICFTWYRIKADNRALAACTIYIAFAQ